MDIYVLRHGDAEERREDLAEADRKLTPKGMRDVQRVVRLAAAVGITPELVLTSPYVRALDSAQIAVGVLQPKPALEKTEDLLPHIRPEQVWNLLRTHSRAKGILLSGHEPQLSRLVALLLDCPSLRFDFKKGALVRIRIGDTPQPHGELKWVITPALARGARHVGASA